jgi:antitoxin (DNA-binding transcriptional repressor) of toxin-antitoxin stability system
MAQPAGKDAPQQVGVREFRGNMTGYLRQVRQGASFLITSRGEVIAELHPPAVAVPLRRQPGALRGKIHMAPDFDVLPADILAALEGEE